MKSSTTLGTAALTIVFAATSAAAASSVANSTSATHIQCNGTLASWDRDGFGMTTFSTCSDSNEYWICARRKPFKDEEWTCRCHPFWTVTNDPNVPSAWPSCKDDFHATHMFPISLSATAALGLFYAFYTLVLYVAVVVHGGKHNFWMLINQVLLVLANCGNVTLPVINVLYDFQIMNTAQYDMAFGTLMPFAIFFTLQSNLMIAGGWLTILTESSIRISREKREQKVATYRAIIWTAQIIIMVLSVMASVSGAAASNFSLIYFGTAFFLIIFYVVGGERLSTFLIESSNDSKSGMETRNVGQLIRFVSRWFVGVCVASVLSCAWYVLAYTAIYAEGYPTPGTIANTGLFAFLFFAVTIQVMGVVGSYFFASLLRARLAKLMATGREMFKTTVATGNKPTTTANPMTEEVQLSHI